MTNLWLAKIIAPVYNNDSTKSKVKHSYNFGQSIKAIKTFPMDYSRLFSLKQGMFYSMSTNSSDI